MVSAEQRPSISATLFLCWVCQGRTFESAPPDHKTLVAAFSKMPPKMERNMWKNALWVSKVTQYFCEVSRLRRSGLREYLLSNRLLMSELKLNPKLALKCTHFWTSCSKVPQRRVACFFFFASMTSLSAVSLATDPYSAPSLLPSALKAPFWLLSLPSEGGYLAAQMQMKLLDLVEGIRWH